MNIDTNLAVTDTGTVACRHCGATVGDSVQASMTRAIRNERPSIAAGPGVRADPALFTDRPIVIRQSFCPGCLVCLSTEIVPADEKTYREWVLS